MITMLELILIALAAFTGTLAAAELHAMIDRIYITWIEARTAKRIHKILHAIEDIRSITTTMTLTRNDSTNSHN